MKETKSVYRERICRRFITRLALCFLLLLPSCHGGGGSHQAGPVPSTSGRLLAGAVRNRIVRYEIVSDPFVLEPSIDVQVSGLAAELEGGGIVIAAAAAYPANPHGWRMRSPVGGGMRPAPLIHGTVDAVVRVEGEGETTCTLAYDPTRSAFVGRLAPIDPGAVHTSSIPAGAIDDGWGNTSRFGAGPETVIP